MSKISTIINKSNFEITRSRIAYILAIELANQVVMINDLINSATPPTGDELKELQLTLDSIPHKIENDVVSGIVYEERFIAPTPDDIPLLNVVFTSFPMEELDTASTQIGDSKYTIEAWQQNNDTSESRGDQRSAFKLQRLLGVCNKILHDRNYKYLGLDGIYNPNFIGKVSIGNILVFQPDTSANNSHNSIYGKFDVSVKVHETGAEYIGELAEGTDLEIEINQTGSGYEWSSDLTT